MSQEDDKRDKAKKLALQKKFGQRITIARQGRDAFLGKDYITASKKYNEYLSILSETNDLPDIYQLSPTMFNQKTQVTELLLISHIFWELARIHEMTPKLQHTFTKCLKQFVRFTVNQPYQVLNAEMLRKYIKKNKNSVQVAFLNDTLSQIFVQSKKCFIATYCYGEEHRITSQLRAFKLDLLDWPAGKAFVQTYYQYSSKLVEFCIEHKTVAKVIRSLFSPPLWLFAKFTQTSIFKACSYFLKLLRKSGSNHF